MVTKASPKSGTDWPDPALEPRRALPVLLSVLGLAAVLGLGLVFILGGDGDGSGSVEASGPSGTAVEEPDPPTTTEASATATSAPASEGPLGDLDAPPTWLCVVGVAADDRLNIRDGPGPDFIELHDIHPRACDMFPTGNESVTGPSHWIEVDYSDHAFHVRGWVNADFIEERPNPCHWLADGCGL